MRIRSIKPEFWRSEDITSLAWQDRLLFIGLWSYVDDNGVGRDNEKLIKADLFPLEDDPRETLATVSRGLQNLFSRGLIVRYSVDGTPLLHITNWAKHQRIDKPNKARYAAPTCENAEIRDSLATFSRGPRETPAPGAVEQGNSGAGEQGKTNKAAADAAESEIAAEFDEFWSSYPRKVAKPKAFAAYKAARKKAMAAEILDGLMQHLPSMLANEMRYRPHASTWLHGERWEDEPPAPPEQPQSNTQRHMALVQQLAAEEAAQQLPLPQIGTGR